MVVTLPYCELKFKIKISNKINFSHVGGYADDIVFIIKDTASTLKNLFKTYHQFSKISGIELNTTKTEILRIGDEHDEREYTIVDNEGQEIPIKSIETMEE